MGFYIWRSFFSYLFLIALTLMHWESCASWHFLGTLVNRSNQSATLRFSLSVAIKFESDISDMLKEISYAMI